MKALAVIGAVFKWIGIVLGALILLILILSLFPLKLDVEWKDRELKARAGYLFLHKDLSPKKKGKEKEGKKEPEEAEKPGKPDPIPEAQTPAEEKDPLPPEPAEKPADEPAEEGGREDAPEEKNGLQELWEKIEPFLDPGNRAARHLARHVQVKDLHASLECVSSDAAVTGMLTGAKWAFLGSVSGALNALLGKNVSYGELKVTPCWTRDMAKGEEAGCKVRFRPIYALGAGIIFLAGWLPKRLKNRKNRKKTPSEAE